MWKLKSLRDLITRAVPELEADPERLIVMATDGSAASTLAAGLSFEYRYTAAITVLDYTGHTDALFVPLLAWVRVHQSDLADDPARRAIEFTMEHLNNYAMDIGIRVPLTERAVVKPDPDHATRLLITHPAEPALPGDTPGEHWELWLKTQKLAEWDIAPPLYRARLNLP